MRQNILRGSYSAPNIANWNYMHTRYIERHYALREVYPRASNKGGRIVIIINTELYKNGIDFGSITICMDSGGEKWSKVKSK